MTASQLIPLARWFDRRVGRSFRGACLLVSSLAILGVGCASQNSNDSPGDVPEAAFDASATSGEPGLTVTFTDRSTGPFDTLAWDFGNGETSSDANPDTVYPDAGSYLVTLTVSGSNGSDTTTTTIVIADPPAAAFACTPGLGFAPLTINCSSTATSASSVSWEVSDSGANVVASDTGESAAFTLSTADDFTVTQRVENAVGADSATAIIEVYDAVGISASPAAPAPPGLYTFTIAYPGGNPPPAATSSAWVILGPDSFQDIGLGSFVESFLPTPGAYTITLDYVYLPESDPTIFLTQQATLELVVTSTSAAAGFEQDVTEGVGPLDVGFSDRSTGVIDQWQWDFGDGSGCVFPAPSEPATPPEDVCGGPSPTHTYATVGRFDVTLTITGQAADPEDPPVVDSVTVADAVTVTIVDPSFEEQAAGGEISGAWTALRPASAPQTADHEALATTQPGGADAGMPTDGQKWASLDGLGTDGSEAADVVENGIRQTFLRPTASTVLEFDYAFLYSEPPLSPVRDAMTATVSDGTTTVEIPSARAEVGAPYAGPSSRYPTLGGGTTLVTPVRTASLDLAAAFPGATAETLYTLTIRVTNAGDNGLRSPRAYVDHIRFTQPAAPFTAAFSAPELVVAGEPATFLDTTCSGANAGGCVEPTSWRWDFDPDLSGASLPASSGSDEQDPVYTYGGAMDGYTVTMIARNADQESTAQLVVDVLPAVVVTPEIETNPVPTTAPAELDFVATVAADPRDPVEAWFWDFAGWGTGTSTSQNPDPITIGQAGTWTILLRVTTESGREYSATLDVVLDAP